MTTFNFTTFDTAIQAKLNTANVSLSAQDYLLLAKAVQTAIETSEGVSLLSLKGSANGIASLDSNSLVPASQLINALPSQTSNLNKILTTNGSTASWSNTATLATITTSGKAYIGTGSAEFDSSAALTSSTGVFNVASAANSYGQLALHNSTSSSSTDFIAYTNNGTDSDGWIDMGITGATFNSATYGITGPHDGYIFMSAPVGTTGAGNLVIATGDNGTDNKIVFAAGGYESGTTQMEITPGENIHIEIPTPSTSPTTGALTVVGGVGVQGDLNIEGSVSIEGTITFGGAGTTVETSNLAVTDPAVFVGTNNQSDIVDLAFIGEYATSISTITRTITNKALTSNIATLTTSANHTYLAGDVVVITGVDATFNGTFNIIEVPTTTTFTYAKTNANVTSAVATGSAAVSARRKFSGIARDASDGVIKAFRDATTKPTSTVNFSEQGLAYADLRVGGLTASSITVGDVSNTEIGYLDGVTSSVQTQLNSKAPLASPTLTGSATITSSASTDVPLTISATSGQSVNLLNIKDSGSTSYLTVGSGGLTTIANGAVIASATGGLVVGAASTSFKSELAGGRTVITNAENYALGIRYNSSTNGVWMGSPSAGVLTWSDWGGTEKLRLDAGNNRITVPNTVVLDNLLVRNATPTGTSYTLGLADSGKLVEFNNSSAITVTVALNSSVDFPVGSQINIVQTGTGQVTIAPVVGVTVNATPGLKLRTQWSTATLVKRDSNTWLLFGDISA
jgi:hypothetical protein